MEIKGFDGTATLTDTHLVFEFTKRAKMMKGVARQEIPLAKIQSIAHSPASIVSREMLKVRAVGFHSNPLEASDPCTLLLGGRTIGTAFAEQLKINTDTEIALAESRAAQTAGLGQSATPAGSESGLALSSVAAREQALAAATDRRAAASASNPQAQFAGYVLADGVIRKGVHVWDVRGANTSVDVGSPRKGVTATRVVMLGVFSLAAKKDKTKLYITIDTPLQTFVIEAPAREERQARVFAAAVARSV